MQELDFTFKRSNMGCIPRFSYNQSLSTKYKHKGALITKIPPGGIAEKAGMRKDDYIVEVNKKCLLSVNGSEAIKILKAEAKGSNYSIRVHRDRLVQRAALPSRALRYFEARFKQNLGLNIDLVSHKRSISIVEPQHILFKV